VTCPLIVRAPASSRRLSFIGWAVNVPIAGILYSIERRPGRGIFQFSSRSLQKTKPLISSWMRFRSRLRYLQGSRAGLPDPRTASRDSRLSGGEVQRVALTSALGSSLVNTLYVLDEPSIGLHFPGTITV